MSLPLHQLCSFRHGGTPSKAKPAYWDGDIPWVSPKDMKVSVLTDTEDHVTQLGVDQSATTVVPEGSILVVARSGILAHSLPVSRAGRPLSFNQDIKAIQVTDERVTDDYVYWFLRSKEPEILSRGVKKGATVHSLQSQFLERLSVPILTPDEQRRVIDLLSRAENIVRMRKEAEAKAKEIIPALFLDMFGDSAKNPRGGKQAESGNGDGQRGLGKVVRFGDIIEKFEGGKNMQAGVKGEALFRILKISAVTSGAYDELESKPAPGGYSPPSHYIVRQGDILFSRANTEELVGATAMVHQTDGKSLLPDKLWRLVWRDSKSISPVYMLALLQSQGTRKELSKIASGTGGSMKNISQAKLVELKLSIAPIQEQRAFERHAGRMTSIVGGAEKATAQASQAFQSLLTGMFGERA